MNKYNRIFRNKFDKRIFTIFCGCTLVPLLVIFCIAYFQVRVNLKDQNFRRLEQTTKAVAMSIYEKLLLLESELRVHPETIKNTPKVPFSLAEGPQHFVNITTIYDLKAEFDDENSEISITERFNSLKNWLNNGMSVLLTKSISKTISRIYMVSIMSDEKGIVIGEINSTYLFGIGEINILPPMTELTVFDGKGGILISSVDAIEPLAQVLNEKISEDPMSRFLWKNADQRYYASRKALFMESRFKDAPWEIVMSQQPSYIYGAMSNFKIIFPLLVLLSVLIVIWASIIFIRRNTGAVETLTNAASGLLVFSTDGSIKQCNPFMSRISGYSVESLCSSTIYDLAYSSKTDNITDAIRRILKKKKPYELFEQEFRHKDGSKVWTLISISIVRDESNEPLYFIALIQDITDQKQSAKEKSSLQEQLHQAQKMEAIGTLSGGIAHDLNNILAGILGYVELAKMETDPDAPVRGRLDKVETAVLRAADLVLQILTFSRKGKQDLQHIYLSPIIKEATKLLRATMPKNISLQLDIKEDTEKVLADVGQIHQIMMNLCTNAIHACEENGGSIEVMLESQMIPAGNTDLNLDLESGNYLKLTVADTGCGIDKNKLAYIFDPFFTTKEQDKGTGLGLSVVHGIIKSHNGTIEVSSEPGKGTTFEVYLPVAEVKCDDKSDKRNDELPFGNERILFVDDEPMLANTMEGLLISLGYEVACFTDPNQALNQFSLDINQFDLVITDHGMPGISGLNLARKLTQQRSDLPVMLITGYLDQINEEQLAKAGIQIVANKPLQLPQLAQHIRELLDNDNKSQDFLLA